MSSPPRKQQHIIYIPTPYKQSEKSSIQIDTIPQQQIIQNVQLSEIKSNKQNMLLYQSCDFSNSIKQIHDFIIFQNQLLGKGKYSSVYMAIKQQFSQDKIHFAAKVIQKQLFENKEFQQLVDQEIQLLTNIHHQNLVNLHQVCSTQKHLYIFLDFCNGGTLQDYIQYKKQIPWQEALQIFKRICNGYNVLHEKNIIHRNLSSQNIHLHNGKPKIGHLSFVRQIIGDINKPQQMSHRYCLHYASPQMLDKGQLYSSKCDIWSLGIILFHMLFGHLPFQQDNEEKQILDINIKLEQIKNEIRNEVNIPNAFQNLIISMLALDESERISFRQILQNQVMLANYTASVLQQQQQQYFQQQQQLLLQQQNQQSQIKQAQPQQNLKQLEGIIQSHKLIIKNNYVRDFPAVVTSIQQLQKERFYQPKLGQIDEALSSDEQSIIIANQQLQDNNEKQERDLNCVNQLKAFEENQISQIISIRIDKLFMFNRNQAMFALMTLHSLWDLKSYFQLHQTKLQQVYPPGSMLIFTYNLAYYYFFKLRFFCEVLNLQRNQHFLNDEEFEEYLKSQQFVKTKQKINKDLETSNQFIQQILQPLVEEINNLLVQNKTNQFLHSFIEIELKNCLKNNEQQDKNWDYYKEHSFNILKPLLKIIDFKNIHFFCLQSYFSVMIFTQIEDYLPTVQSAEFDFHNFYNKNLRNINEEQLFNEVQLFISKYSQ